MFIRGKHTDEIFYTFKIIILFGKFSHIKKIRSQIYNDTPMSIRYEVITHQPIVALLYCVLANSPLISQFICLCQVYGLCENIIIVLQNYAGCSGWGMPSDQAKDVRFTWAIQEEVVRWCFTRSREYSNLKISSLKMRKSEQVHQHCSPQTVVHGSQQVIQRKNANQNI